MDFYQDNNLQNLYKDSLNIIIFLKVVIVSSIQLSMQKPNIITLIMNLNFLIYILY